jgi:hypothetical protein
VKGEARWRVDIEPLVFPIRDHAATCAVHRGAFRTLLGTEPTPQACLAFFEEFEDAFGAAARQPLAAGGICGDLNDKKRPDRLDS